jgi:hypothetical protein
MQVRENGGVAGVACGRQEARSERGRWGGRVDLLISSVVLVGVASTNAHSPEGSVSQRYG